jgi:signal peptidase II (EC:3.4.23.36). Aspartic peptidase. MEROPS family A08
MARRTPAKTSAGLLPWLGLSLIVLILDQFTKMLILEFYRLGDGSVITGFFNIVRAENTGAAFSFLAAASGWQRWLFTGIGVAAALLIVALLRSHAGQSCSRSRCPSFWAVPWATWWTACGTATWWIFWTFIGMACISRRSIWPTAPSRWARRA